MIPTEINWSKDWKTVEFEDTLVITGIVRGQSAAHIEAKSAINDNHYTIFLTDLLDMMANGDIAGMNLSGIFIVRKRGANLGIRLKHTPDREAIHPKYPMSRPIPNYVRYNE